MTEKTEIKVTIPTELVKKLEWISIESGHSVDHVVEVALEELVRAYKERVDALHRRGRR